MSVIGSTALANEPMEYTLTPFARCESTNEGLQKCNRSVRMSLWSPSYRHLHGAKVLMKDFKNATAIANEPVQSFIPSFAACECACDVYQTGICNVRVAF